MREYGQIQCAWWQSDALQGASDAGRLLGAYLLTGPHSNGLGCYRLPDGYVMEDLGWGPERVAEGFEELSRTGFANRLEGVVFIPNFLRWNGISNPNVARARMTEFYGLPKGPAKARVAGEILKFCKHLKPDEVAELTRVAETLSQTITQTVCQTGSDPIRSDPNRSEPNTPDARARTPDSAGTGAERDDVPTATHRAQARADQPALSPEFEQFLVETYPETSHRRDFATAWHSAQGIVGQGLASEADLRRRLHDYRRFVDAGGVSDTAKVPAPQAWFKVHQQGEAYWQREWPLPKQLNGKGAEDPDAVHAWDRLIATEGAERPPRAQAALQAIGGWSRVRERTMQQAPFIRREFIEAYVSQQAAVA